MDNQWVIDFYSQEHWDLVLLERDSKLASFCGLRTRSVRLMLSRIGMVFGGVCAGALLVCAAIDRSKGIEFVGALISLGITLYSWLTNMELSQ